MGQYFNKGSVMTTTKLVAIIYTSGMIFGCVEIATHVVVRPGETAQAGYVESEDTQSASDVSNEVASRISGIDKSNQEITKNLDKQNQMIKQSRDRDFMRDKNNPQVDKDLRKQIYKRE